MNDFYILLAQFFSTCLLQYFYICLEKIKQIKNSNAYENIDLGSLQVWSGCLYIQFGVRNESLEAVLISFDKFVKHDLDECDLYHGFRSFSEEFIIDG